MPIRFLKLYIMESRWLSRRSRNLHTYEHIKSLSFSLNLFPPPPLVLGTCATFSAAAPLAQTKKGGARRSGVKVKKNSAVAVARK